MNSLVTGGAGFIGSNLLRHLRETAPQGKLFDIGRKDPGVEGVTHFTCDLTDEAMLLDQLRQIRPNRIYHLAGASRVTEAIALPEYFSENFLTTARLVRALTTIGSPVTVFFASSIHVYGNQPGRVTEENPSSPKTAHGFTKYLAEESLRTAVLRSNFLKVVVGRLDNCIGPGQPEGFVASDLCRRLADLPSGGTRVLKTGPLSPFRCFLDVRDAVALMALLLQADQPSPFEIYNLASHREMKIRELVAILMQETGKTAMVESMEDPSDNPFAGLKLSVEKLGHAIQCPPLRTIENTLREMFQNAQSQAQSGRQATRPG